jgi:hypothetical protein
MNKHDNWTHVQPFLDRLKWTLQQENEHETPINQKNENILNSRPSGY